MFLFLGFFDRVRSTGTLDNFRPNGNDLSIFGKFVTLYSIFQSRLSLAPLDFNSQSLNSFIDRKSVV